MKLLRSLFKKVWFVLIPLVILAGGTITYWFVMRDAAPAVPEVAPAAGEVPENPLSAAIVAPDVDILLWYDVISNGVLQHWSQEVAQVFAKDSYDWPPGMIQLNGVLIFISKGKPLTGVNVQEEIWLFVYYYQVPDDGNGQGSWGYYGKGRYYTRAEADADALRVQQWAEEMQQSNNAPAESQGDE